ncbi:phage head spike fiber domain-containing protein [Variovorax boronicumulans]|uniref:phage head spike fiber domain-containing protein n=1 Tax=Variovorax boronicumulans TaxID=436515 RepID=UPI0012E4BBA8|nr:hypothetical protein [Variovorax boronicumulans]GER20685.1 hypothetical protein VCH24_57260 [Variovorax boronicumulans]
MTTTLTDKNFTELFTYSGGTNGTCVNSQGLIQPSPTPRFDFDPITKASKGLLIESPRQNLLLFSSRFDRYPTWTRSNATPVPEAAVAPNGRWDACKLILNSGAAAGLGHVVQTVAKAATATTYAYSFYAKAGGSSSGWIYARGASSADSISIPFNLTTMTAAGVVSGGFVEVSKRVVDAGNGWRRVELVFTSDASAALVAAIYPGSSVGTSGSGDGVAGIYIWGAQLETGAFASSYIPSVDAVTARSSIGSYYDPKGILRYAAAGVARNSYEPSNLILPPVLMVEEQRTNILLKSGDMHLSPWTGGGMSRVTGRLAPDGTLRAVEFSGTSITPNTQSAVATATVMTYSIYLKNVSRTANVDLLLRNTTTATNDIGAGVILHGANPLISGAGWEMRDAGNGWFRCTYTSKIAIAVGDVLTVYAVVSGPRADNGACLAWGAQLEAGAFATSYIPSTETFTSRASIGTYFDATGVMKTAAAGAARMTYNPADLTIAPWLMQEVSSTNLLTESEFRNGLADASVRIGCAAASWSELGFTTGIAFPAPPPAGTFAFYAAKSPVLAPSTTYVISCFVKMDDGGAPSMPASGGAADFALVIANAPISPTACTMTHIGGGVYRLTGTRTTDASVPSTVSGIWKYGTNSARTFKFTGLQMEQALSASSYIPTTTATVTRLADIASSAATTRQADTATSVATTRALDSVRIDTTRGWFNAAEGTVFMELEVPRMSDTGTKTVLEFGGVGGRMGVSYSAGNFTNGVAYGYTVIDGTTLATPPKVLPGPIAKIAMSYGTEGVRFAYNNQPIQKVATPIAGPGTTYLGLGSTYGGGNCPFFRIRAARYQPQKLTDAEVVALTA